MIYCELSSAPKEERSRGGRLRGVEATELFASDADWSRGTRLHITQARASPFLLTKKDSFHSRRVHAASQTMPRADQPPSGLILAARITLPHFSVSSTMSLPKAVGEHISGVSPKSVRCAFSFGVARPALISALSLSTTCVGVFLGAPMPNHELTS